MTVTDTNCRAAETISNRNETRTLQEMYAESMRWAMKRAEADRIARRKAGRSLRDADVCGKCEHPIAPGDPVTRFSYPRQSVVCVSCAPEARTRYHGSCEGCGRPVYSRSERPHRHLFCCERCEWTYYNRLRNEAREEARHKRCPVCGERFTAARSDALTCSAPCRQKMYRMRRQEVRK